MLSCFAPTRASRHAADDGADDGVPLARVGASLAESVRAFATISCAVRRTRVCFVFATATLSRLCARPGLCMNAAKASMPTARPAIFRMPCEMSRLLEAPSALLRAAVRSRVSLGVCLRAAAEHMRHVQNEQSPGLMRQPRASGQPPATMRLRRGNAAMCRLLINPSRQRRRLESQAVPPARECARRNPSGS